LCSIVAANRQKELELVFFENRDRPKDLFIGNDIRRIGDVVGIYDFRAKGIACGYSFKSGTAGGVANILGYDGKKSRGVTLLRALEEGKSAREAAQIIKNEVSAGDHSSARYVLCDSESIVSLENCGRRIHLSENGRRKYVVTTNHFHSLRSGTKLENSILRERYMKTLGNNITEESILKLATRHRNPAICRHGRTLSSFIVFKRPAETPRILYALTEPCKGYAEFSRIPAAV
jgi:hypothetical protein